MFKTTSPNAHNMHFKTPAHKHIASRINKPGKAPTKIIDLQYVKIHFRIFNHIRHTNIGAHELWKSSEDYNLANMIGPHRTGGTY